MLEGTPAALNEVEAADSEDDDPITGGGEVCGDAAAESRADVVSTRRAVDPLAILNPKFVPELEVEGV